MGESLLFDVLRIDDLRIRSIFSTYHCFDNFAFPSGNGK